MNVNPLILDALKDIGVPVRWLEYKGPATEYIVFNDALNAPTLYGDDCDELETVITQVHYYSKTDPHKKLTEIRKALRRADFTILDTFITKETVSLSGTTVKNDTSTGLYHSLVKIQMKGRSEDFEEV